jgi:hypothetical protein
MKSYRPIYNLAVLSKILEKFILSQLLQHLRSNCLLPSVHSAYRHHSTETAIKKVASDILSSIDWGNVSLLCSLDLTAAFDTVDHSILLTRLQVSFGFSATVLDWLESFVRHRAQSVCYGGSTSPPVTLNHGVPQGSELNPLLFVLFTSSFVHLVRRQGPHVRRRHSSLCSLSSIKA